MGIYWRKSEIVVVCVALHSALLTTSSHGLPAKQPAQPPVDYQPLGVGHGARVNINLTNSHTKTSPGSGTGWNASNKSELSPKVKTGSGGGGAGSGTAAGGGGVHTKFNIQDYITQRDIDKQKKKGPFWKVYFAELLAATILVVGIISLICWYNWTKRGRQRDHESRMGMSMNPTAVKFNTGAARAVRRGQSMPELYANVNPNPILHAPQQQLKPMKSPCMGAYGKNKKRRWNNKEDSGNPSYV